VAQPEALAIAETPPIDDKTRAALDKLADIAQPQPVSWWPQTWGWALLFAILLAAMIFGLWRWLAWRHANRYRREALAELDALERDAGHPDGLLAEALAIPELLKRVALSVWPRASVAPLSGAQWVEFLGAHYDRPIAPELARLLQDEEYQKAGTLGALPDDQARAVFAGARAWIEGHRVSA
jgi:hypothetical protein